MPLIRLRGRSSAASFSFEKRGFLFGKQAAGRTDMDLPTTSIDDPFGIFVITNALAMAPPDQRPSLVASIEGLLEDRANGIRPEEARVY